MERVSHWRWLVAPVLAAAALVLVRLAAQPVARTPIDHDLPLVALLIGCWAWAARDSRWSRAIEMAVPLLAIALLALGDHDRVRLAAFGIVAAGAFAIATVQARPDAGERCALLLTGLVLLRWMPLASLEIWRELLVAGGTLLVFAAVGGFDDLRRETLPLTLTAALAAGLVTPIHPARAMLFPYLLALLLFVTRSRSLAGALSVAAFVAAYAGRSTKGPLFVAVGIALLIVALIMQRRERRERSERAEAPSTRFAVPRLVIGAAAVALLALWPWSGVLARALPLVARYEPHGEQQPVGYALAASESATLSLPQGVRHLIVTASGANAARLRTGRMLGTVEGVSEGSSVCRSIMRIGDVADFGFGRPSQFFASRNAYPRRSEWDLRDYGMQAWVYGAGRVSLVCPREIAAIKLTAAADLPPDARLQIESIETSAR